MSGVLGQVAASLLAQGSEADTLAVEIEGLERTLVEIAEGVAANNPGYTLEQVWEELDRDAREWCERQDPSLAPIAPMPLPSLGVS